VKVAILSAKKYDYEFLNTANGSRHHLGFFEAHLNEETVGSRTSPNSRTTSRLRNWRTDSDATEAASTTGHLLDFALQKSRGNLGLIPATDAVAA
jgi:hypothetical protein